MNKYLVLLVLAIMISACNSTPVKTADSEKSEVNNQNLSKTQLEKLLMGRYQVIAGAWFVNKQCNILSESESALLEKHVGGLNIYAQHNQLAPSNILHQMQKNAQFGASLPKYKKCGEEAKTMVLAAHQLSTMLFQDLVESK